MASSESDDVDVSVMSPAVLVDFAEEGSAGPGFRERRMDFQCLHHVIREVGCHLDEAFESTWTREGLAGKQGAP